MKISLVCLMVIIMAGYLFMATPATAIGFSPINMIQQAGNAITVSVSDFISFLLNLQLLVNKPANVVTPPTVSVSVNQAPVPDLPRPIIFTNTSASDFSVTEPVWDNNYSEILFYTNQERAAKSLPPLSANHILDIVALGRVDDLFTNQYFEHESPDGKSVSELAKIDGYSYLLIGENLALGNYDNDQAIVTAWMNSAGHRANILNGKYTELGVAVRQGIYKGEETTIAVQVFGRPLANCAGPNTGTKNLIDSSSTAIKQMQADAKILSDNLAIITSTSGFDVAIYRQKVAEYNLLARRVNDAVAALKSLIDIYNAQVAGYNVCIAN